MIAAWWLKTVGPDWSKFPPYQIEIRPCVAIEPTHHDITHAACWLVEWEGRMWVIPDRDLWPIGEV